MNTSQPLKALTIGGSDSGGAAGIQADLKTWTALGVYGMSAITAVTAQNSVAVLEVSTMPPELVARQITAVLSDYGAQGIKTGFLGSTSLVQAVASCLEEAKPVPLVVDPVLVNHQGRPMFAAEVAAAYNRYLLPLATLITPNWRELALLAAMPPLEAPDLHLIEEQARLLAGWGAGPILVTGVPGGRTSVDWLYDGRAMQPFPQAAIITENRHGSGDTLSAAICAYLAHGRSLADAVRGAQLFTARALAAAAGWQLGKGHGPLSHFPPDTPLL